jgi:hypothetical protein
VRRVRARMPSRGRVMVAPGRAAWFTGSWQRRSMREYFLLYALVLMFALAMGVGLLRTLLG